MENKVLLADGAMGTMLQKAGLPQGQPPEKCNVLQQGLVRSIHGQYIEAGAQLIGVNSFGGNGLKLSRATDEEVWDVNFQGARLAREEAGSKVLVAGSMGPTGKLLQPWGELSLSDAVVAYEQQARALAAGGVDLLMIETMMDLQEARAAFFGAVKTGLPVAVQLTFEETGRTVMGTSPEVVAAVFAALNALWVGTNCGIGPLPMMDILKRMQPWAQERAQVLAAFPNAGLPTLRNGGEEYLVEPEEFVTGCKELVRAGAQIIGGCCGTTPQHISELGQELSHLLVEDCRVYLDEIAASRIGKESQLIPWVIGGNQWQKSPIQSGDLTAFLATRTTIFPLGSEEKHYHLERVGSLLEFDPFEWKGAANEDAGKNLVALIDVPANLTSGQTASLVGKLQMAVALPVVFTSNSPRALEEALLNYCGRAGVMIPSDSSSDAYLKIAGRFGALPVYG